MGDVNDNIIQRNTIEKRIAFPWVKVEGRKKFNIQNHDVQNDTKIMVKS